MAIHFTKSLLLLHAIILIFSPFSSTAKTYTMLNHGSSLSSPDDVLISLPNRIFTAGFYPVGDNAYCFAIWYTQTLSDGTATVVWMANRDQPVNGRNTKLSLSNSGNLQLYNAGKFLVWTSGTESPSTTTLQLHDDGDLVLRQKENSTAIWRSFDSPTDTLLPHQPLTKSAKLISSRSRTNYSSGFYQFYFDYDNVLRLLYSGVEVTSVFWPPEWIDIWYAGRSTYNTRKTAVLDSYGNFTSSDNFKIQSADTGVGPQRRMTLDPDGLVRVYSLNKQENKWEVSWQLRTMACSINGICGANSLCTYTHESGRRCVCLPGYRIKNNRDWSEGCVPDFHQSRCLNSSDGFSQINHAEIYGYDIEYFQNTTLEECESLCLSYCDCKGFQFKFEWVTGVHSCYPKTFLFNGYQSSDFDHWIYVRLPKKLLLASNDQIQSHLYCTSNSVVKIDREHENTWLRSLIWCVGALGAVELTCLLIYFHKTRGSSNKLREQGIFQVATGFKRFTYAELKKATRNFSEEIGRGGSGVVYKGVLSDKRVAAIKCLNVVATQGEAEFLAEISLIGRLNHANLIERWGYSAEGKHRLLVYEYLGNGSLADSLSSNKLDWRNKFEIALGTAKGLAYLPEECLEWVLHCDVKPHNILLDSNFQPKVADFGLSKQVERNSIENLKVSMVRGTRGYMEPEWVYNLPITAKVDVYSYGVVVLEMVSGKSPQEMNLESTRRDVDWVNASMGGEYEYVENLVRVALLCVQENRDTRPIMTQVVDMLLDHNNLSFKRI